MINYKLPSLAKANKGPLGMNDALMVDMDLTRLDANIIIQIETNKMTEE